MTIARVLTFAFFITVAPPDFALAQGAGDFPNHPVKILVPFAPGGATDVVARILADLVSARWNGQSVVVENRPGAGTIIATAAVAKAPPDGHTLLIATNSFLINPAVGQKLPYDPLKDFVGVSMIATQPTALVASKSFAPNTIPELVALAKSRAEPLSFASPGPRGVGHFSGELLKQRAGINMVHITYNGGTPATVDVIAGRVPILFDVWHSAKRYVDSGDLKLVAGAGAERLKDAPDVATIGETYPGFAVAAMNAIYAPAGIPAPVLEKLSADIRAVIESAAFAEKSSALGIEARGNTPTELDAWTRAQIANWSAVAKAGNIKVD